MCKLIMSMLCLLLILQQCLLFQTHHLLKIILQELDFSIIHMEDEEQIDTTDWMPAKQKKL